MSAYHLPLHGHRPHWFMMPLVLFSILYGSLTFQTFAQQEQKQDDPRALDPADVFFQAWLTIRDAEKLEKDQKFSDAWRKYRQAAKYYDTLSRFHKNWKPHLVKSRIKSTTESIKGIEPQAAAEIAGKKAKTKDLVEGSSDPTNQSGVSGHEKLPNPTITPEAPAPTITLSPADQKVHRRLNILEAENKRLRESLTQARSRPINTGNKSGQSAEEKRLIEQIAKRDRELTTLRNILARAPLQKDMDELSRQNRTVKAELTITARALKESQKKLGEAQKTAEKYKENAELAQSRAEKIQKNMDAQKKIDNRVFQELKKEYDTVTKLLESTRRELGAANNKVAQMQRSLAESQATIQELTKERDDLRTERDALRNILTQNDSSGVQKLIAENMRLGKELKEATDRLTFLKKDNDATKDQLVEAKRDLAIAKTRIMRYQDEEAGHGRRIKALEQQLRDAEIDLAAARKGSDKSKASKAKSEEVQILRDTVKRLIATQERQRTASKILWETYQKSQVKIPGLQKIINDIRNTKVELTEQEEGLLAFRAPDGEFTSPERVSLSHARTHATVLEKEIATYNPLMKRAFEKGRFEAARQILQDMDERFPGHFPTLCNRGVIELKTENFSRASDFFNEAITMRENSSYAHHMLGLSFYELKDLDSARNAFQRALDLKPDNASAHLYLGILAGAGKRYQQAEQHFLTSIKLNPTLCEAYFNLSVTYLQQKKKKEASDYYAKALEHGLAANTDHELQLTR